MAHKPRITYRPEIDGLRAVAVLAVLFYHAKFYMMDYAVFSGGFLGVDIFFVISGYLITAILLQDMAQERFRFRDFYERRVRRILPALFFVLFATIPCAWIYMFPQPFSDYGDSLFAATLFGANILFWMQDSYTAAPNALKPLLHTWSLSLEEQFYVLFPILLFLCWRYMRKHLLTVLCLLSLLSLELSHWGSVAIPKTTFYWLPMRGWELLAGAILAVIEKDRQNRGQTKPVTAGIKHVLPMIGAGLILYSLLFFTDDMRHPSFYTVLPVLGTVLIIAFAGQGDIVGKILSTKICVAIGLISYSLYLWHQPVFAFDRIRHGNTLEDVDKWRNIVISILLAFSTWKMVEQPFRDREKIKRKTVYGAALLCAVFFVGFAALVQQGAFQNRFPKAALQAVSAADTKYITEYFSDASCIKETPYCARGAIDGTPWAVVGDSHMERLSPILWHEMQNTETSISFTAMDQGGCPYVPGLFVIENGKTHPCDWAVNMQRRDFLLSLKPGIVVLGGRLHLYLNGTWFDNGEGGVENTGSIYLAQNMDGNRFSPQRAEEEVVQTLFKQAVQELVKAGHRVVLIYPVPEVGWNVPEKFAADLPETAAEIRRWLDTGGITTAYTAFEKRSAAVYRIYDALGQNENILRIYPEKMLCNTQIAGRCITHDRQDIFYQDDDHLSLAGGTKLVKEILQKIDEKWGRAAYGTAR